DYAIILLDANGKIINWNKGAEHIKGYAADEILQSHFSKFYQESDARDGLPQRLLEQAVQHGKATDEGWRMKKDGSRFWGYVVITALRDKDNNLLGFSKITRDLTERKVSEELQEQYTADLRRQNELLR